MFLGYADGHAAGTYRIWNPETKKMMISHDVIFLRENYGDWNQELVSPRITASMLADSDGNDLDIHRHINPQLENLVRDSENESEIKDESDSEIEDEPKIEHTSENQDSDEKSEPVQSLPSRLLGEL